MSRTKKRPTYIKSLRVDFEMKEFLESLDNANEFVLQILRDSDKYQEFLKELEARLLENQPTLFD